MSNESQSTEPRTATVEVLTAAVHVLMVGSRQVTLSVYRQLDECRDFEQFVPFGRVHVKSESHKWELVGVDKRSGALVRVERHKAFRVDGDELHEHRLRVEPEYWALWAMERQIRELPLIVLAGLR
jgi:hypothetical protein